MRVRVVTCCVSMTMRVGWGSHNHVDCMLQLFLLPISLIYVPGHLDQLLIHYSSTVII